MFKNNDKLDASQAKQVQALSISCLLIFTLVSFFSYAQQAKFSKTLQGDDYVFNYQWRDHQNKQQEITFSLAKNTIFDRYRDLGIYRPTLANEYINNAMQKYLKKNPIPGVSLSFRRENGRLTVDINGRDQELVSKANQQLSSLQAKFTQQYLTEKYYQHFTTPDLIEAVKLDHRRIALGSVEDLKPLKPLILEKAAIKNVRIVTNYVLSFIQSIPYSPLASRITSSGASFNPPLKVLWENQGDCDSKVTLTVSMLRALMPRIKMALVFIDNHALFGIEVIPKDGESTLTHENVTYVLAEPTGPALLTLGTISSESEQAINNGYYVLEPFHTQVSSANNDDNSDF